MKTLVDHLPVDKQDQLRRAVQIICDMVKPDILILFGSYARGDWVEDMGPDGVNYRYQSDFDLLAVVRNEHIADKINRKDSLWGRLHREIKTPVSLIAEDIHFINNRLEHGQYFFADIQQQGIVLFDSGHLQLSQPRELNPTERLRLAEDDFGYWLNGANDFYTMFKAALERDLLNIAAFNLHQVTERLYTTILLVFTHYKPSTHDLKKLGQLAASIAPEVLVVFPQATVEEKHCVSLLRKAYVDARYKREYRISAEELAWLEQRVVHLKAVVERLCLACLQQFRELN